MWYEMRFCPKCEHFKPDKVKKEGAFIWYGCNKRGYIPQAVKEFKHIACGCGEFEEKQQTQLSLF